MTNSYKKLYEDLSAELMLYKSSFEFSVTGKIILDANYKVVTINKSALKYLNITPEQAYTSNIFSFFNNVPKDLPYLLEYKKNISFTTNAANVNSYLNIDVSSIENIGAKFYVIHLNDVSDLTIIQQALVKKNNFIDNLLSTSPNMIYVYDLISNSNVFVNEVGAELLGYTPEDLHALGDIVFNVVLHPDDLKKAKHQNEILKNAMGNDIYEIEYRMKTKNGTYHWYLARERVFKRDSDGVPIEKIGTAMDITTRKQSEELIRLHSAAILDAKNGMVITDRSGIIIWVNNAFCDMMGYTMEELVGQTPKLLKSGLHSKEFYKDMWSTILSGEVWFDNITNKTKYGGIISTKMVITPIKDELDDVTHFIAIKQLS